jgi:hypothetical protein
MGLGWSKEKQVVPDCHVPLLHLLEKWLETPQTLCYVWASSEWKQAERQWGGNGWWGIIGQQGLTR